MSDISIWQGGMLKTSKAPASGEIPVGNGSDFNLTQSNITFGNPIVIAVPITVNGQVSSTTGGFKFPDNTVQTSAATSYSPPTVATGTIQSNISGSTAAPTANTISAVLDNLFGTTQGTVIYRGASTWAALAPGTSGQYLQTQGAGANPQWATVSAPTWTTVKRTTDQSYSSTIVSADSQLQFTMLANTKYKIRAHLDFLINTTSGLAVSTYGPAATSYFMPGGLLWSTSIAGAGSVASGGASSVSNTAYGVVYADNSVTISTLRPNVATMFEVYVSVGATGGTFGLSIGLGSGSSALTLKAGSYIEYAIF